MKIGSLHVPDRFHMLGCGVRSKTPHDSRARSKAIETQEGRVAKTTVTFELGGRVEIEHLAQGISLFRSLMECLTPRGSGVAWVVEDLQPGSAVATLHGEAPNIAAVERIVGEYESFGASMSRHEETALTDQSLLKAASGIRKLATTVEYVRFETSENDYTLRGNGELHSQPEPTVAIGAVTGRIQTLSSRAGLRFNLYDTVHDKAVGCYLAAGQEELMREVWGRRARVSGRVSREARTDIPIAIRRILNVELLADPEPGSYESARGAVPWRSGYELPEQVVHRLRDA